MKRFSLTRNIGLKAAALIFSILLWFIVVNVDDPVETASYSNIPLEMINEEVVTSMGKTYGFVDEPQPVRVTVSANRSVLSRIDSSNIVVTADLSQMETNTYLVPITASVRGVNNSSVTTEVNPTNVQVKIEDVTKNIFPISVSVTGTPRNGYVVGEMTTNPEKITIRGTESAINNIQKVVASVDVSGMSESRTKDAELIILDGNNNAMDQSQLANNLGEEGLSVNVQILSTKNVPLSFYASGKPADGFIFKECTSEPSTIQICGKKEDLAKIDRIEVPPSEVDISGATERREVTVDILPYLPEGVSLVDEAANNVIVTAMIEQEGVKTIVLPVEAIQINNLREDLKLSFESEMDLELQFTGEEEVLEVLDIRYAATIDLKNYKTPGTYEVPVNIAAVSGVELTKEPTVKIVLTEKEE